MDQTITAQPDPVAWYARRAFGWLLTIVGVGLAVVAILLRLDIATEELHRIAVRSWCPVGSWSMTSVAYWGPMLVLPSFVAWFSAKRAAVAIWPSRVAALTAGGWWLIGATIADWPRWLL